MALIIRISSKREERVGETELLLLSALFFHQGYTDDTVYCAGEKYEVCWGDDLMFDVRRLM